MEESIRRQLEEIVSANEFEMVLGASTNREAITKVKIHPVKIKNEICFQIEEYRGSQVFHRNLAQGELMGELEGYLGGLFRQADIRTAEAQFHVLVSKKGKVTVIRSKGAGKVAINLEHNRKKRYLLEEGTPIPFLCELGVMTPEGRVVKAKYDKFRQINRFLEFVDDVYQELVGDAGTGDAVRESLTIVDFGCGKSYLTFALYHYLKIQKNRDVRIIGLDLKKDVIAGCARLAERLGYEGLTFLTGDIADYEGVDSVDMVVTLHACDTATDYALEKAVRWGARVILSVPCCQHELNRQLGSDLLEPVLKYGLVKERLAALVTDALRGNLLEEAGYRVQLLEFIDMEHTPKNILIRATRKGVREARSAAARAEGRQGQASAALTACMEFLHVDPTLARLLRG